MAGSGAGGHIPSELGRRVARRREELGLSVEQVAARARMASGYLDYLEHQPAHLSTEALLQLARALEMGPADLLGKGDDWFPHGRGPVTDAGLEELDVDECLRLISGVGIGRVVVVSEHGPMALPVNYALVEGGIVFRTAQGSDLAALSGVEVGFEVDHLDEELCQGWSVLVAGTALRIRDPAVIWRLRELIKPWAGGERSVYIRIGFRRVTGRRVRAPGG